jgi:hypothetical protein
LRFGVEIVVFPPFTRDYVGIEGKASDTISSENWKRLDVLSEEMGNKMTRGLFSSRVRKLLRSAKTVLPFPYLLFWHGFVA